VISWPASRSWSGSWSDSEVGSQASDVDFLLEYLHQKLTADWEAELRLWFGQFEADRLAWRVDRCQRLWGLLAGLTSDRLLTQARAHMMRVRCGPTWATGQQLRLSTAAHCRCSGKRKISAMSAGHSTTWTRSCSGRGNGTGPGRL